MRGGKRGFPWMLASALFVLGLPNADASAAPVASGALMQRPYDAPAVGVDASARAVVPPVPMGYIEHKEEGVTFAYHPSAHERVRAAISPVLRARASLGEELGREVLQAIEIRVAAVPEEMRSLGPLEDIPRYAPALVFSRQKLVVASLGSPRSLEPTDLGTTLRHALAHAALDEAVDHRPVPLWLHEGYAVHIAGDASAMRAETLVVAALRKRLLPIAEVESSFPGDAPEPSLAYAEAADFVRFLMDKPRRASFSGMVERVRGGEVFDKAIAAAYEADVGAIEQSWRKDVGRRYGFFPVFLVGVGVWVGIGVVISLRRAAEKRKLKAAQGRKLTRPPTVPQQRVEVVAQEMREIAALSRPREDLEREGMGQPMPPEAEVPKVEHDGDWHTLH